MDKTIQSAKNELIERLGHGPLTERQMDRLILDNPQMAGALFQLIRAKMVVSRDGFVLLAGQDTRGAA